METVSDLRQLAFLFYICNHFYPVISPANKSHISCCPVVSSSEGHLNYFNIMRQLNIQNWLCHPYPAKKAPLEKGNIDERSLNYCVLPPLATALVWTQRCQVSQLNASSIVHLSIAAHSPQIPYPPFSALFSKFFLFNLLPNKTLLFRQMHFKVLA